jgi:hypothetical protein
LQKEVTQISSEYFDRMQFGAFSNFATSFPFETSSQEPIDGIYDALFQ